MNSTGEAVEAGGVQASAPLVQAHMDALGGWPGASMHRHLQLPVATVSSLAAAHLVAALPHQGWVGAQPLGVLAAHHTTKGRVEQQRSGGGTAGQPSRPSPCSPSPARCLRRTPAAVAPALAPTCQSAHPQSWSPSGWHPQRWCLGRRGERVGDKGGGRNEQQGLARDGSEGLARDGSEGLARDGSEGLARDGSEGLARDAPPVARAWACAALAAACFSALPWPASLPCPGLAC